MHVPHPPHAVALALLLTSLPASAGSATQAPDARALFLTHCASCHGESGDGKGTTELDRPARSFQAGGFSFGNTPEAVFRTITHGIPGSPMASFATALTDDQRKSLASYVISLGPGLPPPPENSELVVGDRPLVVRGMLPPLTSSAILHPRGLAIGLSSGMTFEYRTDDVRFLGIRQGRFVDRTDWSGRGGTPLAPLGQVVHTLDGGNPGAMFSSPSAAGEEPLRARFRGTFIREGTEAGLRYSLVNAADEDLVSVEETCASVAGSSGTGYRRLLQLISRGPTGLLHLHAFDGALGGWRELPAAAGDAGRSDAAYKIRQDGRLEVVRVQGASRLEAPAGRGLAAAALVSTEPVRLTQTTLISNDPAPAESAARVALAQKLLTEVTR